MEDGEVQPKLKLDFDDLVGELDQIEEGLKELKGKIDIFKEEAVKDPAETENKDSGD